MRNMFYDCPALKGLNLTNFNINNVTDMYGVFFGCPNQLQNTIRTRYIFLTKDNH